MILSNNCECGGKIEIITFVENNINYISHGICIDCFKIVILPQEELSFFLKNDNR